jgi:hypothetical protein
MLRIVGALTVLLSVGCSTAGHGHARSWEDAVLDAACRLPEVRALAKDSPVWLSPTTRPVFLFGALFLQTADRALSAQDLSELTAVESEAHTHFSPVKLPSPACTELRLEASHPSQLTGYLEVSSLARNPFTTSAPAGVFVRLSLGQLEGASWFWIELVLDAAGRWSVVQVVELEVHDG